MKVVIAIIIGKFLRFLCRVLKKGGTGFPGKVVIRICPNILEVLSKNVTCIVVTGTNGKTTSVRMIEEAFSQSGKSYFANLAGANLQVGIITEFIVNSTIFGKCKKEYAILETDEFASKEVCRQIHPKVIFVTNLFVDQVERFGGVKGSFAGIQKAISNSPESILILNAEDSVSSMLGYNVPNPVIYYGIGEKESGKIADTSNSDVDRCILCDEPLSYKYRTYSHLGGFKCDKCGAGYHVPDYYVSELTSLGVSRSEFILNARGTDVNITVNLPAIYNVYNAIGAYASLMALDFDSKTVENALASFKCGFGRMEKIPQLGKQGATMILIKNGAGCDQVISFLGKLDEKFTLCFYLNNNVSDGVDITWIDNVNFEALSNYNIDKVYISGMRCDELYDRVIKAGIDSAKVIKEANCSNLISILNKSEYPVYILPTYTGMMAARSEIIRQCGGKEFWEENR